MYEYKIKKIIKVYDADTITVDIDLGFGVTRTEILRLNLIDAPEMRGVEREDGIVSRDWLRERLATAMEEGGIIIRTVQDKKGKYGRYIAEVFVDEVNINRELVSEGLAIYKSY